MREVEVINRGGFGVVHKVEIDGQHFAKKTFDPQIQTGTDREKLRRRFVREVKIQSRIKHPNIMPIFRYDLDTTPPWFLMPLASASFEKKIAEDVLSSTIDKSAWQDILAAVEELHRLGYVHRDLKPGNVLKVGDRWVIADFGLVLPTVRDTTRLTGSHTAFGSHYYAAPEQAHDFHNVSDVADIFALGCILHDTICDSPSRVPFAQIHFDGPYAEILGKCTAVDARERFQNVAFFRAALFDLWQTEEASSSEEDDDFTLEAVQSVFF
ncbi:serine/threonine-protein kinase [Edaphobacter sp. 12200R-103]|uniref:serine/threonine-protein kinase n=1 Tax=Edaphobacter sp. 12200R-103 TaxID=2703788 RepID=UPI00138D4F3E|nr:serine/threonine-protein kinase [Edaphobacter sp. 12200R-103]QHS50411.1 serine/threonine protein kinase [Edaphobacter sp. 12200R-103]